MTQIRKRMARLMQPIDRQIMMCDDREETMMLACAMLQSCITILDASIGTQGRKEIITDANKKD
jgi:hypothetical protein